MAYEEVSRVEISEVIRQWQAGRGIREITRLTGLSRNTIRKYILTGQSRAMERDGSPPTESQVVALVQLNRPGPREVISPTDQVLEPRADRIEKWIKQDRLKLTRIQDLLAQKHCLVAYACLRRSDRRPDAGTSEADQNRGTDCAPCSADFLPTG